MIGERAGGFCDEWFGDDPKVLEKILARVLELAPSSDSALQRLSVIYTVAERWADVLALYDRAIDATKERGRRIRLLREAAQLAKDVANQPEQAIGYYQQLLPLVPDDAQVSQGLERLLERHERWADLIALWEGRLEGQIEEGSREEPRAHRGVLARQPEGSAERARRGQAAARRGRGRPRELRAARAHHRGAAGDQERARRGAGSAALALRRDVAAARGHPRPREDRSSSIRTGARELREEAGQRLAELDDLPAAMDHYAALLAIAPESTRHRGEAAPARRARRPSRSLRRRESPRRRGRATTIRRARSSCSARPRARGSSG